MGFNITKTTHKPTDEFITIDCQITQFQFYAIPYTIAVGSTPTSNVTYGFLATLLFRFISLKAVHRGSIMNNTNELTTEQIQEFLDLKEILDDLETTPKSVLRAKLKKFAKDASKYEEGKSRSPVHTSGWATAEIYQEFQHVVENGGTEADMSNILDRIR
ncbi:hypothetical protein G6F37_006508 [Rhizopus arrhizus]|nr:hypothetical protein G6F37_006508 [Rhizopus arrhizus]